MSNATKGRAFEHEIQQLLEGAGFSVVRGAASKGEFFGNKVDLVASREGRGNDYRAYIILIGVQCKVRSRK